MRPVMVRRPSLHLTLAAACLLIMMLAACGTLDISLDETPEAGQAAALPDSGAAQTTEAAAISTPSVTPQPAASWGPLTTYTHPIYGYQLLVPESAAYVDEDVDESITLIADRGPMETPAYSIIIKVLPAPEQTAEELLLSLAAGEIEPSAIETLVLDNGGVTGAMVRYNLGAGAFCAEMRPLLVAYVYQGTGYAMHIFSDGPGRCDAGAVPEAMTIVQSFRPPANRPVLPMTPTPTPASLDDLAVVFTQDGDAWLWTRARGVRQLTIDGGVDQVLLSDDGRVVAFRRGNGLWAVNADGSNERQLVRESDLPIPQDGELVGSIAGVTFDQLAWIPGTHQLLFNTRLLIEAPGLILSDDLWKVDADTLVLDYLLAPGDGGNFAIAPDGSQVALVTPDSIALAGINGDDRQRIFSYTPVLTYSEFRYYARPVWSANGDVLGVVIPPPDRLATEIQAFGVWRLHTDGTPATLAGTIEARGLGPLPEPVINPSLDMIAYLSGPEVEPARADLLFVTWGEAVGQPVFYTSHVDSFNSWSPDGRQFSFSRPPGEAGASGAFTGQLDQEPRPVADGDAMAFSVRWLDADRYLYLQSSEKGWDLLLTDRSGFTTPIASVVGLPPAFDAAG